MMHMTRASLIAVIAVGLFGYTASAQSYPTHPITMIVPFAAGGPADIVGRIFAKHLSKTLPVVVENIGGAGGNLGSDHVARAAPDGYTLLFQNMSMAISPSLYKKLQYDPLKSFDYIGLVAYQPNVVLTGPTVKADTFAEFEAYLKANQSKLTFANSGTGGASYLCAILFMNALKLHITSVPYRGTSQAMTDLLGGHVDLLCNSVATAIPYIKAGSVRAFGVTSPERFSSYRKFRRSRSRGCPASTWSIGQRSMPPRERRRRFWRSCGAHSSRSPRIRPSSPISSASAVRHSLRNGPMRMRSRLI